MQNYSVNQHLIEALISWIKTREIAIPEIQRPFVWKAAKVRDLIDSLYKGYPVGSANSTEDLFEFRENTDIDAFAIKMDSNGEIKPFKN